MSLMLPPLKRERSHQGLLPSRSTGNAPKRNARLFPILIWAPNSSLLMVKRHMNATQLLESRRNKGTSSA